MTAVPNYLWRSVTISQEYRKDMKVGDRIRMESCGSRQTMQILGFLPSEQHPGAVEVQLSIVMPTSVTVQYLDAANRYAKASVTETAADLTDQDPLHLTLIRHDIPNESRARRIARVALARPDMFAEEVPE